MSNITLESIIPVENIHPYRLNGSVQCLENVLLFWKILTSYYGPQFVKKPQFIRKMYLMAMLIHREYDMHVLAVKEKAPEVAAGFSTEDFVRGFVQMLDFNNGRMMNNLWSEAGVYKRDGAPQSWELHPLFVYVLVFRFLIVFSGDSKNKTYRLKFCPVCKRFLPHDTLVCFKAVKGDSPEYIVGHNDVTVSKLLEDQNDLRLRWNAMTPSLFVLPAYEPLPTEPVVVAPPPPPKKPVAKKMPAKQPAKKPANPSPLKVDFVMDSEADDDDDSSSSSSSSEDSSSDDDDDLRTENEIPVVVPTPTPLKAAPPAKPTTVAAVVPEIRKKRAYVRRLKVAGEPIRPVARPIRRMANPFLNSINMDVPPSTIRERIVQHDNTFYRYFYNPLMAVFGNLLTPQYDEPSKIMYFTYREKYHIFIVNDTCLEETGTKWYVMMGVGSFRDFTSFGQFSLADVMKSCIDQEELRFKESGGKPNTDAPIENTIHTVFRHSTSIPQQIVLHDDGQEEDEEEEEAFNDFDDDEINMKESFLPNLTENNEMIDPHTGEVLCYNRY